MPDPSGTRPQSSRRAPRSAPKPIPFSEDCKQVLQRLRGALTDALTGLALDPSRPQGLARSLGLHRNLAWKVSKIVTGSDVFAAVTHIPGRGGREILLKALEKARARGDDLARIRTALEDFDRLIDEHAGDRGTLEFVAGGLGPGASQREAMLQARRLAFRGNSVIWGLQARVNLGLSLLAPSAHDPRRVDLVQVNGLVDFRALRPDVVWPLFRRTVWGEGHPEHPLDGEPLAPVPEAGDVPLLLDFCSPDLPPLEVVHSELETTYWLPARKVGRTGELTCIYGSLVRGIGSQHASGADRTCEMVANLVTPVELLHLDLLVHDSLAWARDPRATVTSLLERRAEAAPVGDGRMRLPIDEPVHELGLGPGTTATPHLPSYRELLAFVFARTGWDPAEFRGYRYLLEHPPVPARVSLSMDLLPEERA